VTLNDIKLKIGRRVSDPEATRYGDAIEDYFIDSMCEVIASESVSYDEIAPLVLEEAYSLSEMNAVSKYVLAFDDLLVAPKPIIESIELTEKTTEQLIFALNNDFLKPALNEGLWSKEHNVFRFLVNSEKATIQILFKSIKNPDKSDWGSTDDLVTDLGYGRHFIYQCINLASAKMKAQIGLE